MLIAHWYENREAVVVGPITSELPAAVESLLWGLNVGTVECRYGRCHPGT